MMLFEEYLITFWDDTTATILVPVSERLCDHVQAAVGRRRAAARSCELIDSFWGDWDCFFEYPPVKPVHSRRKALKLSLANIRKAARGKGDF